MQWLTRLSLKNPAFVVIICLLVIVGGIYSFAVINVESEPQAKLGMITVSTGYPNASAKDVLEDVTKPLEKAIDTVSGVKTYISSSQENHSLLTISIDSSADMEKVQDEIEKSVANTKLPNTAGRSKVKLRMVGSEPMYFLAISNQEQKRSDEAFYRLVEDKIVEELQAIKGVESVEVIGTQSKIIRINPRLEVLHYYGMTVSDLRQSIAAQHTAQTVGSVTGDGQDYIARVSNEYTSLADLQRTKIPLPKKANSVGEQGYVELGSLADVQWELDRTSISRLNGKSAVAVQITKTAEGNIVEISDTILEKLADYRTKYPDLSMEMVSDRSDFVKSSIGGMAKEGIMGIFMAIAVIFLFLRSVRTTMIVVVSIPLCVLVSVICMQMNGITLNIMSLFGMTVAIGRVVDDSIVVIENIFRRFQHEPRTKDTIRKAVSEVGNAITSSTLTTVAVFLPIAFVSGMLGDFFKPFAAAVSWSLLASLLVAVTVVPLLASITMSKDGEREHREGFISQKYVAFLKRALAHKGKVALVTLLLVGGSVGLASRLPTGFLPELNMNLLYIKVSMPTGTSLDTTSAKIQEIEQTILQEPQVMYVQSKMGAVDDAAKRSHLADMTIKLKSGSDEDAVQAQLRKRVEPLIPPNAQVTFSKPAAGGQGGYQLVLYGKDMSTLQTAATTIKATLKENPQLANIKDNVSNRSKQVTIKVDRDQALRWGLTPEQVAKEVSVAIGSTQLKNLRQGEKEFELVFGTGELAELTDLPRIWIKSPSGQQVSLEEIATLQKVDVTPELLQKDGEPYIQITADILNDVDKGGVAAKQTRELQQLALPDGVKMSSEGVQQDMQKGFTEMIAAMGAAVFLVLLVLVASFGNLSSPIAVLLSIPLASVGGLLALWMTGGVMDMTVMIGFLMLIGIVVTNAIVLIDRVQQHIEEGISVREAIIEAGRTRLRPIMMTAVATIAAMLPLALGFSEGSMLSQGLSFVVIGGLLSSTLMTLIVVPVGYEALYRFTHRKQQAKRRNLVA
ncbi:efflux RND transporter permease subunit [Brevibacillus sp. FIR094]|uniref:efflux RND transporter permease subunit n=1 Tax=Brevibacillus sp. FIR094 TaxID=3134809 RepID=UPI003D2457C5